MSTAQGPKRRLPANPSQENLRKQAKVKILVEQPKTVPGAPQEPASAPPASAPASASNSLRTSR